MSVLSLSIEDDDPWVIQQIIFDILNGFLQPESTVAIDAVAEKIDAVVPTNRDGSVTEEKEDMGTFLWNFWEYFFKVAEQIPYSHPSQEKLARLLMKLSDLPSQTPMVDLPNWAGGYRLWQDLPLFGPALREEYDSKIKRFGKVEYLHSLTLLELERCQEHERKRNLSAFLARITRDRTQSCDSYAYRAISDALGVPAQQRHEQNTEFKTNDDFQPGPLLAAKVAIAHDWISIAGSFLYSKLEEKVQGAEPEDEISDWAGLVIDSQIWQFWKKRIEELSAQEGIDETTRELATESELTMEHIEAA